MFPSAFLPPDQRLLCRLASATSYLFSSMQLCGSVQLYLEAQLIAAAAATSPMGALVGTT